MLNSLHATNFLEKIYKTSFFLSFLGFLLFILDFGYNQTILLQEFINGYYFLVLVLGVLTTAVRYLLDEKPLRGKVLAFDIGSVLLVLLILYIHFFSGEVHRHLNVFFNDNWVKFAVVLTFIREFAERKINYSRAHFNPAQVFIFSFLGLILVGAGILMLPNATQQDLNFIDALFTATSAVCVTGLIVVDTGSFFTPFGQAVILLLIQTGGIGILTFASYFSYFFKGVSTYENQLVLSDMTNSQKLGEVFSTLKRVLIITFSIELIGAALAFLSTSHSLFASQYEHLYFSVFHSVSAFCNAGFSTLPNGLYEEGYRFNYSLQLVLAALFIFGGLGFPIVVNISRYVKYILVQRIFHFSNPRKRYKPWLISINSRITLITTLMLTLLGTLLFFITEFHNTLQPHQGLGKWVVAFFGAATPRTAGFNNVDMAALQTSTILITMLLMWIGASPASTGGGIKTSTFAIATLNFISLAKGKTRTEIFRREIADISIRRAFAVIALSLMVIGLGILAISIFDPQQELLKVAFECFSAYSTVGLSLGITAQMSDLGKMVLILMMFIGRVSMLTIMIAIFRKEKYKNYRYPTEEITIN